MKDNQPITIYHNPRCSKSRQTLHLLQEHGHVLQVIEYLRTPPDKEQLKKILGLLGMEPHQLMRTGEKEYKELGLDKPGLSRDELIEAMVQHPILIERPIVLTQDKAAIGRPPEKALEIL